MTHVVDAWEIEDEALFQPAIVQAVPGSHLARFFGQSTRTGIDLGGLFEQFETPDKDRRTVALVIALLGYGFHQGLRSSRSIEQACGRRTDFLALTGGRIPPFRFIADFRDSHLKLVALGLRRLVGVLGELGVVVLDETLEDAESHCVAGWLKEAKAQDAADDAQFGADDPGTFEPPWVADAAARTDYLAAAREAVADRFGMAAVVPTPSAKSQTPPPSAAAAAADDQPEPRVRAHSRRTTVVGDAYEQGVEVVPPPSPPPRGARRPQASRAASASRPIKRASRANKAPSGGDAVSKDRPAKEPPADVAPAAGPKPAAATSGAAAAVEVLRRVKDKGDRVLLIEASIGAAVCDGELTAAEQRRVEQLLRFLRIDAATKKRLTGLMRSGRKPATSEFEPPTAYDTRLAIFEEAAMMAVIDGLPNPQETEFLRGLAVGFELAANDVKAVLVRLNEVVAG